MQRLDYMNPLHGTSVLSDVYLTFSYYALKLCRLQTVEMLLGVCILVVEVVTHCIWCCRDVDSI